MGLLNQPLFNIGLGLMSESGPSYRPNNYGRGVMMGLLNARENRVAMQEQQRAAQEYQMKLERFNMERAQYDQKQAEAARQQQLTRDWLARNPDASPSLKAMAEGGDWGGVYSAMNPTPQTSGGVKIEHEDGRQYIAPTIQAANAYLQANPDAKLYQPPPTTAINLPGTKPDRVLSAAEAEAAGLPTADGQTWVMGHDGGLSLLELSPAETRRQNIAAAKQEAISDMKSLADRYIEARRRYSDTSAMSPGEIANARRQAEATKQALINATSRFLNPGAEPGPNIIKQAEAMIPDFEGPYDAATFNAVMEQFYRQYEIEPLEGAFGANAQPAGTPPMPPGFVPENNPTSGRSGRNRRR